MRLTHLFLTCCLLVSAIASLSLVSAQDESASATGSMASVSSFISTPAPGKHHDHHDDGGNKIKINKDIDIEAKDIIVNVGKVDIDIEIEKQKKHGLVLTGAAPNQASSAAVSSVISNIPSGVIGGGLFHDDGGNKIKINKEIDIEAKDIIVNVGKVDVDIEIEKQKHGKHGGDAAAAAGAESESEADDVGDELQVSAAGGKNDHHNKHHDGHDDGNKIKINKDIDIEAKDIIVNIGKVKVDVDIEKKKHDGHATTKPPTTKPPTGKPTWKPTWKPKATHFEQKMNQLLGDAYPSHDQPLA